MLRLLQQVIIQELEYLSANCSQLILDLLPVHLNQIQVFIALYSHNIYQNPLFFVFIKELTLSSSLFWIAWMVLQASLRVLT